MPDELYDDIVAAAAPPKPRKVVRGMEKLTGVQPDLINHWNNLQGEFDKAGIVPTVKSGFRTAEQQNSLHRRGFPTKGNDGYIKRSPHQDGRSLDLGFNGAQKAKGHAIIADYAKRNGLHVPLDEPWHIAIPKQQAGQTDDEYADVVEAAMGQDPDNYDDVVSAASPARSRFGAPRQRPVAGVRGSRIDPRAEAQKAIDAVNQAVGQSRAPVSRVFENRARLPVNPRKIEIKPRGFNFNQPSENQVKADIRNQLVSEIATSTPEGRMPRAVGPELDAEVEARFKQLKQEQKVGTIAAREGPSMGARNSRIERAKAAIAPYTPGLQSLDTAAGIKLDAPRGAIRGLTLGALGDQREITAEERILNPDAESRRNFAEGVGEMATGFVPYVGAGKLISKVPALNRAGRGVSAVRTGATFGGVETAREGIRAAKTGESFDPKEVAISTAIGAAMGGIPGMSAGLKTRIAAAIGPQVAVDYARGTPIEQALLNAGTNFVFEVYGRKLGVSKKKFEEIRTQLAERQTVPSETQRKLNEVNIPEKAETVQLQLDQRGYTLVPKGNPKPPLPRGTRAVKTDDGIVYYDPRRTDPTAIRSTPTTELLGHVEPKGPTTTEAVVARDPVTGTEIQSSAVSPENVAKQAEVTQAQFPEAKVEVGDANLAAEVIAERVAPQRYRHLEFGDVVKVEDQSGAAKGRVKVHEEADPTKIHYPKTVDLQGRGNSRMIPIKEAATETAIPTAEAVTPDAAPTSRRVANLEQKLSDMGAAEATFEGTDHVRQAAIADTRAALEKVKAEEAAAPVAPKTPPTPKEVIEAAGAKYIGTQQVNKKGDVGHMFNVGDDTLMIKGEVTPEIVKARIEAKLAENAAAKPKALAVESSETPAPLSREAETAPESGFVTVGERPVMDRNFHRRVRVVDPLYGSATTVVKETLPDGSMRIGIEAAPGRDGKIFKAADVQFLDERFTSSPDSRQVTDYETGAERDYSSPKEAQEAARKLNANPPEGEYFKRITGKEWEQQRYPHLYDAEGAKIRDPEAIKARHQELKSNPSVRGEPKATVKVESQPPPSPSVVESAAATDTPQTLNGRTYTRRDDGTWVNAEGRRIAGAVEKKLNGMSETAARETAGESGMERGNAGMGVAVSSSMTLNPKDVANYFESEFRKYTQALADQSLSVDRVNPENRVSWSDLAAKFPELNKSPDARAEIQPLIDRVIRKLKKEGVWDGRTVTPSSKAATPELQPHADAAAELRSRLDNPELSAVARAAIERKAAKLDKKAEGEQLRRAGADPYDLIDDIIIRGDEIYRKAKPKFDAWAKSIKAEYAEAKDKDLREIYAQLSGKRETTSVQNKASAELREDLGLLAMERPESKSWETAIANAEAKGLDKQAEAIADRVIKGGREEGLDYEESAGILIRTRELENQWEDAYRKDPNDPKLDEIKAQLDKFTQAVDMGGTEPARTLNFRKAHVDKDFRLISMIKQAEATKGRKVTPEETTRYDAIVKERDTAIKERDKAMEQLQSKRLQNELDRASRQRSRADTKEKLDKEAVLIRSNIAAEFARIKKTLGSTFSAGGLGALDPDGVITRNLLRYARNRAKAEVGLKAEALIDDAYSLVKDFGVTRRQVAEAISGYGKQPVDRRSEAAKKLADIRAEMTAMLKAEDIAVGKTTAKRQGPKLNEAPKQGPRLSEAPKLGPQNAIKRNAARLKELQRQEAEWERKFNERDFDPKAKPEPYPYNSEVRKADDRVKIAEAKFRREMERARPGHQFRNLSGIWKAWLLSGPQTQMMNIIGTGAWQGFREVSRLPAGIADAVWSATNANQMFGQSAKTPRSIQGPSPIAMIESVIEGGGKQGLREFMETMRHGAPTAVLERHQFQEIDFGVNSRAIHAIELAHNAIFRFMSGSDRVFWNHAYRRNLIDRATMQAKNEGVSNTKQRAKELVAEADGNTGHELHANASHDAFVDTFNNDNALSTRIKRARAAVVNPRSLMGKKSAERLNAAENFALDLILPFDRTPTNVITRILEASPLGYGKNAAQLAAAAVRGNMPIEHQRQMMQTFGNATAGTALMAMGWYLADPEKGIITVEGQDVYLNIPKLPRIPLRTASPAGNILASGARARAIHDDPKSSNWDYVKLGIKEPVNQPLLRATSSVNDIGRDPKTALNKFAGKTASSAIPFSGASRFAGQMLDPADRRYADNSFTEQFKRNVPVSRETLPSSRVRLLGSEVTKATKEAERLKITMRGATKQTDETDEDFAKREAIVNPAIKAQIETIVEHPDYDGKSDEDKTRWLKEAAQFATKRANDTIPEKPEQPEKTEFPMPTPKGVGFDSTYPADALAKFERMSPTQRAAVRGSMEQKARVLLRDPRLSDEQKAEFKKRLDALGISTAPRRSLRELQASPP